MTMIRIGVRIGAFVVTAVLLATTSAGCGSIAESLFGDDDEPKSDGAQGQFGVNTGSSGGACVGLECQQVACANGGTTSLRGTVMDPSGTVPLYNAVVYVPNAPLAPFTPGVSCD